MQQFTGQILRKKFLFALFAICMAAAVCTFNRFEGAIFRDIVICIACAFLGTQAYVDAKQPKPEVQQ